MHGCDEHHLLGLARSTQSSMGSTNGGVVAGGSHGGHVEHGAHGGAPTPDAARSAIPAAVVEFPVQHLQFRLRPVQVSPEPPSPMFLGLPRG